MLEVPGTLLLLLAALAALRSMETGHRRDLLLASGASVTLFLCKYNYGLMWLVPWVLSEIWLDGRLRRAVRKGSELRRKYLPQHTGWSIFLFLYGLCVSAVVVTAGWDFTEGMVVLGSWDGLSPSLLAWHGRLHGVPDKQVPTTLRSVDRDPDRARKELRRQAESGSLEIVAVVTAWGWLLLFIPIRAMKGRTSCPGFEGRETTSGHSRRRIFIGSIRAARLAGT